MKGLRRWVGAGLLIVLALSALAAAMLLRWAHGLSARDEPSGLEKSAARRLRRLALPARAREMKNPVAPSADALTEARGHFADHCAICHANDGRGRTEIGQHLYPRAPDMTLPETQSLTDGELFHVIKYGVRLTGMPAWGVEGSRDDDVASWKLVHFIRHLPELTPAEVEQMEKLNPKSPGETDSAAEEEKFLAGEDTGAPSAAPSPHHH